MDRETFFSKVLFVIVVYERALATIPAIWLIKKCLPSAQVFIYDNSAYSQRPNDDTLFYVHNPMNAGVSRAYNLAADFAGEHSKSWMCLLDQDTEVTLELFQRYHQAVTAMPDETVFVPAVRAESKILSPYVMLMGKGLSVKKISAGRYAFGRHLVINSGLLISTEVFSKAGGYDETFPLDYSDSVFCKRLQQVKSHFVVVDASVEHEFSGTSQLSFDEAMTRFVHFASATVRYSLNYGNVFSAMWILFTRAANLSIRFRSFSFLTVAFDLSRNR